MLFNEVKQPILVISGDKFTLRIQIEGLQINQYLIILTAVLGSY